MNEARKSRTPSCFLFSSSSFFLPFEFWDPAPIQSSVTGKPNCRPYGTLYECEVYFYFIFTGRINPGYKSPEKFNHQRRKLYRMRAALHAFKHILFRATFCFAFFQSSCSLLRFLSWQANSFKTQTHSLLIHALEKLYQAGKRKVENIF